MSDSKAIAGISSILAVLIFVIAWIISSTVAHIIYMLSSYIFGDSDNFTLMVAAGISAFFGTVAAAYLIDAIFKNYWKKFVFWTFVLLLFIIGILGGSVDFNNGHYFKIATYLISMVTSIITAYKILIEGEKVI